MRYSLVSGADAAYFPLLMDLVESLKPLNAHIGVLDVGLTPDQVAHLASLNIRTATFAYPYSFPAQADASRDFPGFNAMLARPYLNELFPEHPILMWMDADTWAQEPQAILEFIKQAELHGIAAVPEVDRSYGKFMRRGRHLWNAEYNTYRRCFGDALADHMRHMPVINSGVWAAQITSPLWAAWRKFIQQGLEQLAVIDDESRVVEQAAFNLAIDSENLKVQRFPATYNWLACFAVPAWHAQKKALVDPNPPHNPINIVHISTHGIDKSLPIPLVGHARDGIHAPSLSRRDIERLRAFLS